MDLLHLPAPIPHPTAHLASAFIVEMIIPAVKFDDDDDDEVNGDDDEVNGDDDDDDEYLEPHEWETRAKW